MFLKGRPGLSPKDIQKVTEANLLVERTIEVIKTALANGRIVMLENPLTSRLWLLKELSGADKLTQLRVR